MHFLDDSLLPENQQPLVIQAASYGPPQLARASWFAVWSRPDVAPEIQQKIRAATLRHFEQPPVKRSLRDMGMEPGEPLTSEAMTADAKAAYEEQAALLKAINFQPD